MINGATRRCYKNYSHLYPTKTQCNLYVENLEKVWPDSDKASEISVAFAINVCEALLNPDNETILIKEEVLKETQKKSGIFCKFE